MRRIVSFLVLAGALGWPFACAPRGNDDVPRSGGETIRVEGDLPCDVERVLVSVCQFCHTSPPRNGAPFPLVTFADVHAVIDGRPVYEYMAEALAAGRMPLPPMDLDAEERALLIEWTSAKAPPREAGASCELGRPRADAGAADAAVDATRDAAVDADVEDAADAAEGDP